MMASKVPSALTSSATERICCRLARSPATTASAPGSLRCVASARWTLRACKTTEWPCSTNSCAAIRPSPSEDPLVDEGLLPSHFQLERLYKEDCICAVARESHFGDRLPLKQYLAASHIVVSPYEGLQTIPDKQLAAVGAKRGSCIRVPYFGVALQCLPGTELVLTLTTGMTSVVKRDRRLRLVKAPRELHAFHLLMAWHPRLNSDPRHVWLRSAMRSTTGALHG